MDDEKRVEEKRKVIKLTAIKEFFSTKDKPVTNDELRSLLSKMTPEEKSDLARQCADSIGAEIIEM